MTVTTGVGSDGGPLPSGVTRVGRVGDTGPSTVSGGSRFVFRDLEQDGVPVVLLPTDRTTEDMGETK